MTDSKMMTEAECVTAANAWLEAKDGRIARYGVAEANTPVDDNLCIITTTEFFMLDVNATTGKVRFAGVSPARPPKLSLTSRAKMGRVRPAKSAPKPAKADAKSRETKLRVTKARKVAGFDWAKCPSINAGTAQKYADMLIAGTTAHSAHVETGLDAKERCKVEKVMSRSNYRMERTLNPDRAKGNRLTTFLYKMTPPEATS